MGLFSLAEGAIVTLHKKFVRFVPQFLSQGFESGGGAEAGWGAEAGAGTGAEGGAAGETGLGAGEPRPTLGASYVRNVGRINELKCEFFKLFFPPFQPLQALESHRLAAALSRGADDPQGCASNLCHCALLLLELGAPDLAQVR